MYIYLHQAEDNLFVSPCDLKVCLYQIVVPSFLLLFPSGRFFIILLNILSSDILPTCAYHSSFLLLIHWLIFLMLHASLTSSLSNSVKFEIYLNVLISAASRICVVFAISCLVSAAYVKMGRTTYL